MSEGVFWLAVGLAAAPWWFGPVLLAVALLCVGALWRIW